jgi:hypothetical protein
MVASTELTLKVWNLAKLVPASKRARAEAVVADSLFPIDLPWDAVEKEGSWLDVSHGLLAGARCGVFSRWQEVLTIESVLDEVAADFAGEDLALPEIRQWLAEAKQTLEFLSRLVEEEKPALVLDGPPLMDLRGMLSED